MNWIPEIMAVGQGDLNSPAAQKLGRKLWLTSSQGKYIVDQVKYFKTLGAFRCLVEIFRCQSK
ncbi:hypothetical protein AB0X56_07125 [Weissella paramesenteroides]|uniref:hypothetical protein n=1 Tax=Weissella paramesenteroides TaxID=1249 RepID=UPI003F291B77